MTSPAEDLEGRNRVYALLQKRLNMFIGNSGHLHKLGKENGRGAFLTVAHNLGDLVHELPRAVFIDQDVVREMDYDLAIKHVRDYDPSREVVLIASVVLNKVAGRMGANDSLMVSCIMSKDAYKLVGDKDKPLHLMTGKFPIPKTEKHVCVVCKARCSKVCGGCGVVSYCSRDHSKAHWPTHKTECKQLGQLRESWKGLVR